MKAYLTRFNNLSDAVCNVEYLCHRGCSMSLRIHENCSITLAVEMVEVLGTPRSFFFFTPAGRTSDRIHALLRLHSRRRCASFPAELPVVQKGFSCFCSVRQTLTHKRTGVNSWLLVTVEVRRPIKSGFVMVSGRAV